VTVNRVTQGGLEVLADNVSTARVTQGALEVLASNDPDLLVSQGGLEVLAEGEAPDLIITQGGLEVLALNDPSLIITQVGLEALEPSVGPRPPTVTASNPTETTIDLAGDAFDQFSGSSAVHSKTRWWIYNANTHAEVYDSGESDDLLAHTPPVDTLPGNTDYYAKAEYKNGAGEYSWPGIASNIVRTLSTPVEGTLAIRFYNSSWGLISEYLPATTTATAYGDWQREENIPVPLLTRYIVPCVFKVGTETDDIRIKEVQIDRGRISAGYYPTAFRPEIHDEADISAAGADEGTVIEPFDIDWSLGKVTLVELGGDVTMTWSNLEPYARYYLIVEQDVTGTRLLTWPTEAKFAGGTTPTLTTTAGAKDVFELVVESGSVVHVNTLALDSK